MADELTQWAQYHATLFGLDTERDAEMLLAWVDVFREAGYDAGELREASQWLAAHDAPRYRSDPLAAIQAHVRQRRERQLTRRDQAPDDRGACTLCGGSGRVIVPDPRAELNVSAEIGRGEPPRVFDAAPGCRFRWRCPLAIDECSHVTPALEELRPHQQVACHVARSGAEVKAFTS